MDNISSEMDSSYRKFVKDNLVVGAGDLLVAIANLFILLPFLTKTIGAHGYGIWSQVNITIALALTFVGLGLPYAMTRFLAALTDKKEIRQEFYSILFMVFLVTLLTSSLLIVFSNFIAQAFFEGATGVVRVTSLIVLIWSLDWAYLSFFRTFRQMWRYFVFTTAQKFCEVGLIIYWVLNGQGILGAVSSLLVVRFVLLLILFYVIKSEIGIERPRFLRIKEYLSFGLPAIPGTISSWVVSSSDKYIIGLFLGATWVGIYSAGYTLGNIPVILIGVLGFVLPSALSKLYDEGKINEVKNHLSYSLKYFLAIAIPFVFGAIALSRDVLEIFTTRKIAAEGYFITPLVALSVLFYGFYNKTAHILVLVKKTKIIGAAWSFAALANFLLNILFIPWLGILGAALTTLIAYILAMGIVTYYAFKEFKFDLQWHFIIKSLIASIIMFVVICKIDPVGEVKEVGIAIMIGTIIYGASLCLLKGFEKKEFEFFKRLVFG